MDTFKTKTGFGYIKNHAGFIVAAGCASIGEHPLPPGHSWTEVSGMAELEALPDIHFGYLTDLSGRIVGKCELPAFSGHPLADGFTFHEVTSASELEKIVVLPSIDDIRRMRNKKLAACDWTQNMDAPLSDAQRKAWAAYRQKLRDFLEKCDPANLVWPKPPKG